MKALVATGDRAGSVRRTEVAEPVQRPDEVLVKVDAFSVNRGEIFQLEGAAGGARPGKDVTGLVVQAAPDGSGPAVGQRVVGHPAGGGWAEFVAVPAGSLAVLPRSVPAVRAAALPLAGLTALRLLRTAGSVTGRRILLTGASGGVGHYVTELAAAAGASVTAVTASAERGERLAELGAASVVRGVEEAEGVFDLVLESTGGRNLPLALSRLAPRGELVWFGQASREPAVLDFFGFFAGPVSATVRHFSYADHDGPDAPDLATLVRLVAEDRLHPEIGLTEDWLRTPEVLVDLRDRRIRGNAVLTLS
ncbi:zinc-binding dehydrogenase [Kitasatospora herbaricolor]|uniref:Zinc-binding dehydrogenase n=1 Tax=Kitasatospora herbaricolor TaxID=68217 RepID=A0ABZ1W3I7_9ACTN|nr:zinc-binding dehydrogenase [Kitasatospora herbaricolor]